MDSPQPLNNTTRVKVATLAAELSTLIFKDPHREDEVCCRPRLDSQSLRKIFHTLTRIHFSSADNYGDLKEELACLAYDPDPAVSTIDVLLNDLPRNDSSPAAAVIVSVRETKYTQIGIGDFAGDHPDGAGTDLLREALTQVLWRCRHPDPDISRLLAQTLADFLMLFKTSMALKIGLHTAQLGGISDARLKEKPPNTLYETFVYMDVSYSYALSVREESHVITRFNLVVNPT